MIFFSVYDSYWAHRSKTHHAICHYGCALLQLRLFATGPLQCCQPQVAADERPRTFCPGRASPFWKRELRSYFYAYALHRPLYPSCDYSRQISVGLECVWSRKVFHRQNVIQLATLLDLLVFVLNCKWLIQQEEIQFQFAERKKDIIIFDPNLSLNNFHFEIKISIFKCWPVYFTAINVPLTQ